MIPPCHSLLSLFNCAPTCHVPTSHTIHGQPLRGVTPLARGKQRTAAISRDDVSFRLYKMLAEALGRHQRRTNNTERAMALPLSSSSSRSCFPSDGFPPTKRAAAAAAAPSFSRGVWAKAAAPGDGAETKRERKSADKQSLFGRVADALDFSQVRSSEDALLLDEAREATRSGGRMTREQYGALRRKIGGTYKDFFKSYVEVEGQYVEDGWVDKTCRICKKDTRGEPRQVDNLGRYAHTACLEGSKSTSFFSKLFSR